MSMREREREREREEGGREGRKDEEVGMHGIHTRCE